MEPKYLGDGVYVSHRAETDDVVLTTGHHDPSLSMNIVVMEPEIVESLLEWLKALKIQREKGGQ